MIPVTSPDSSTSEMDERRGSLRGSNAKRPSSLNILARLNNKRKASDMEETGDSYIASHIRSPIKQEPGLPIDDSPASRSSASPSNLPIKQEPSNDNVLPARDSDNSNSPEDKSKPSSRLDASLPMVKKEADSPDHDSPDHDSPDHDSPDHDSPDQDPPDHELREGSDVEDRASSQDLSEPDMWDVSESEFRTSEAEEDSSSGESTGSERDERREPDELSRGPDNLYEEEESDEIVSRRRPVKNQNSNSRKRPSDMTAGESNRNEQNTPSRGTLPDHGNPASEESSEIPENRRNIGTTTAGNPRKRAAPKKLISARNISRSWKTATPADKMLMKMKEKGCDWLEIRKAWQEITGEWPATSTLPNRYQRIKNNLTRLKSGDVRMVSLGIGSDCAPFTPRDVMLGLCLQKNNYILKAHKYSICGTFLHCKNSEADMV